MFFFKSFFPCPPNRAHTFLFQKFSTVFLCNITFFIPPAYFLSSSAFSFLFISFLQFMANGDSAEVSQEFLQLRTDLERAGRLNNQSWTKGFSLKGKGGLIEIERAIALLHCNDFRVPDEDSICGWLWDWDEGGREVQREGGEVQGGGQQALPGGQVHPGEVYPLSRYTQVRYISRYTQDQLSERMCKGTLAGLISSESNQILVWTQKKTHSWEKATACLSNCPAFVASLIL